MSEMMSGTINECYTMPPIVFYDVTSRVKIIIY